MSDDKKKPKLDTDKIAKGLGAKEHFPLETPINPQTLMHPEGLLKEIRDKRAEAERGLTMKRLILLRVSITLLLLAAMLAIAMLGK